MWLRVSDFAQKYKMSKIKVYVARHYDKTHSKDYRIKGVRE